VRHVLSAIAGLIVAPLAWLLYAYGEYHYRTQFNATFSPAKASPWLLLVLLAGILLGVIATLRISPAGAVVAGAGYLLATAWNLIDVPSSYQMVSGLGDLMGMKPPIMLADPLFTGAVPLVGAALLVAGFSRQRWLTWPGKAATAFGPPPGYPGVRATGEPASTPEAWQPPPSPETAQPAGQPAAAPEEAQEPDSATR
jgi:hypothetical protein